MQKNTAGQKWRVFAFDRTTNAPVTGDAANITGKISKDFGAATAITDTNPAEVEDGYYEFDLSQAETNAQDLLILPQSGTANVVVVGCPARIATTPVGWSGDIVQTGDSFARIGTSGAGLTSLAPAATALSTSTWTNTLATNLGSTNADLADGGRLDVIFDDILLDTGTTLQAELDGVQADTEDIQSRLPATLVSGRIDASVGAMAANVLTASALATDAVTEIQSGLATAAELLLVKDRVSYCLTVLVGACADAGTAAETYVHAIGGETFTVDYTGLDATGNRTTTTLSKV